MNSKIETLFNTIEYRYEPVSLKLDLTDFLQNLSPVLANIQVELPKKEEGERTDAESDEDESDQSVQSVQSDQSDQSVQASSVLDKPDFKSNTQSPPNEIKFGIVLNYDLVSGENKFYTNHITKYETTNDANAAQNTYIFQYQNGKLIQVNDTDHYLGMFELINKNNKPKFSHINVSYLPNSRNKEITLHFFNTSLDWGGDFRYRKQKNSSRQDDYSRTGTGIDSKQLPANDDDVILPLFNKTSRVGNLDTISDDDQSRRSDNMLDPTLMKANALINKHEDL